MKAAVCYTFGAPLVVEEVVLDPPQIGEVRIKLAATAICHSDIHTLHGEWSPFLPLVAGHESAGVVQEIGPGVTLVTPGDRVIVSLLRACGRCFFCVRGQSYLCEGDFALNREHRLHTTTGQPIIQGIFVGGFAEEVIVEQSQVLRIPDELPFDRAALLACGVITGVGSAVHVAAVAPGMTVVVIGAGGVGLNAIQGARLAGATWIIALDTLEHKLEIARQFGATHTLIAAQDDVRAAVLGLTDQRGADVVIISVGSTAAVEQGLKLARKGGTITLAGLPQWKARMPLQISEFAFGGQRLLGSHMGSSRLAVDVPWLIALYQQGRLKLDELITNRYALSDINAAIASTERGEALRNIIEF